MNNVIQIEDRVSRSRSKHEGESSASLCDRLSRTREVSQRQLPDGSWLCGSDPRISAWSIVAITCHGCCWPCPRKDKYKNHTNDSKMLTGSHHIREE